MAAAADIGKKYSTREWRASGTRGEGVLARLLSGEGVPIRLGVSFSDRFLFGG